MSAVRRLASLALALGMIAPAPAPAQYTIGPYYLPAALETMVIGDRDAASDDTIYARPGVAVAADPCRHRVLCGAIRVVPRDPVERAAFVERVTAQLVDGIVTAAGLRARSPYVANTSYEADPVVRPFSHGGLPTLLVAGIAWDIATGAATRRWSPSERTQLDRADTAMHAWGIGTWLDEDYLPLQRFARLARNRTACGQALAAQAHTPHLPGTVPAVCAWWYPR